MRDKAQMQMRRCQMSDVNSRRVQRQRYLPEYLYLLYYCCSIVGLLFVGVVYLAHTAVQYCTAVRENISQISQNLR